MCDIEPISPENREKEDAVWLLLGAIRKLPQPEQDRVFALLLGGLAGPDATLSSTEAWRGEITGRATSERVVVALHGANPLDSEAKVLPVRLPSARHDELKAWCEEHGFPMAAVVRGLVERFLESQGPGRA